MDGFGGDGLVMLLMYVVCLCCVAVLLWFAYRASVVITVLSDRDPARTDQPHHKNEYHKS